MHINSKLPNVGTTIFTEMSVLAQQHNAVNLGQGFPDFDMDPALQELVCKAMKDGHNQYVHSNGLAALRDALAEKANGLYGCNLSSNDEVTITPGGTYAIYTALTTILQPGDEVIIFEPAYDCYLPAIELCKAVAVPIQLDLPNYTINWEMVKTKVSAKTKAIIINSPHNPTGKVLEQNDIDGLISVTNNSNLFVISDEVYEHLVFDGKQHLSVLKFPALAERSFVCYSFGKTYHCTGWKVGYCIAPAHLMAEFRKIHQFNCFSTNSTVQFAFASYLQNKNAYSTLGLTMQKRRDYLTNGLSNTLFEPLPSFGSYFQLYSYAGISDLAEKDFAIFLTKQAGVTTIPVSSFYIQPKNNKVVRFCFAKKETTLDIAIERLIKFAPR